MKINCLHPQIILHPKALYYIAKYKVFYINGVKTDPDSTPINTINPSLLFGFYKKPRYTVFRPGLHYDIPSHGVFSDFLKMDDNDLSRIDKLYAFITSKLQSTFVLDPETGETFPIFQCVPCGKCRLCAEKRYQEWYTRSIMESNSYPIQPLFFTLTYNDTFLPPGGYLCKKHIVDWKKRFIKMMLSDGLPRPRPELSPRILVRGEYGHDLHRPHYHVLLWNYPFNGSRVDSLYYVKSLVRNTWYYGDRPSDKDLDISFSKDAGKYVMRYMHKLHPDQKESVVPSFFLRPLRPALGLTYWNENLRDKHIQHPEWNEIIFTDQFTNKLIKKPLVTYFRDKIFPSLARFVRPETRFLWHSAISGLNDIIDVYQCTPLSLQKLCLKTFQLRSSVLLRALEPFNIFFHRHYTFGDYSFMDKRLIRRTSVSDIWKFIKPIILDMLRIPQSYFDDIDKVIHRRALYDAYLAMRPETAGLVSSYAASLLRSDRKRDALEHYNTPF